MSVACPSGERARKPTCLATPPSRIRSTMTSPGRASARSTATRCRPAAASMSSLRLGSDQSGV